MNDTRAAILSAANRIDPEMGAFITVDVDKAIRTAAQTPHGRLSGLVIAVKDLIDTAGMRTTYGSPRYIDHIPSKTAPAIRSLCAQGAIIIGKTNLNEYAFGVSGYNPHFGPILLPGERQRTVGGSSGGSAAAVAAGVCDLAVGTDTSGSVRIPAACCGVWGFKCASGPSLDGIYPLSPRYDSLGYLTAGPEVLRRVLNVGPVPTLSHLRVGEIGHDLEVPVMPNEHWVIFRHEARKVHQEQLEHDPDSFGDDIRLKLNLPLGDLTSALNTEKNWRVRFREAVAGFDVVIQPVIDGTAPLLSAVLSDYQRGETSVTDRLLHHTPVANALGWPALAFPTARGPRQALGPPGSEASLIAVAEKMSRRD